MFSLTHRPNLPPSSSPAPLCANNFADDDTIWNSPLVCRVRWETSGTLGMASHNVVLKTEIREDIVCALRCDDYILFNEFLRQNSRSLWMPFLLRFIVPVAVVQRAVVGLVILCLNSFSMDFSTQRMKALSAFRNWYRSVVVAFNAPKTCSISLFMQFQFKMVHLALRLNWNDPKRQETRFRKICPTSQHSCRKNGRSDVALQLQN